MNNNKEIWKTIPDYPNYEVSNYGRVRSKDRTIKQYGHKQYYSRHMPSKILKPRMQKCGYLLVWLSFNGKSKPFSVHRLVANCFCQGKGTDVNHIDGDKINNCAWNLEWVSRSENIKHAYRYLKRPKTGKKVICIETEEIFNSMRDAGRAKGVNPVSIGHVLAGRNKTAGGYTWKKG